MNHDLRTLAKACQSAARQLASASSQLKNQWLERIAEDLLARQDKILAANRRDLEAAEKKGLSQAMTDRLVLNPQRLQKIAAAVLEVAALNDPVGEVSHLRRRPNGIRVGKMRIPLGVIAMIYESRPNVTVDAAVLCVKAGNGIILRGGSEAFHTNTLLADILQDGLAAVGLPREAVCLVPTTSREAMNELLILDEFIDLIIPRGGEGLIRFVNENSRIPVIKHYKGVCHLYVDRKAEPDQAVKLLLDGKTSRPGVCNALETVLVHREVAGEFWAQAGPALKERGVEVRACQATRIHLPGARPVTDEDYHAEFLDLIIAARTVASFEEAIAHIHTYGSDHTEVIATRNIHTANQFVNRINSSVVMVNASSRFSDGGQLGLGAEIGISTTKLHAFGPMGLEALTTEKFIVQGEGQVRV